MADYAAWRADWQRTAKAIRARNGEVHALAIARPAVESEVRGVEEQLSLQLPAALRDTLLSFASRVHFRWSLRPMVEIRAPLRRLDHGELHWDLDALCGHEESRQGWAEIYDAPEEARVWANKLAFQRAPNGDLLAIDLESPGHPVVYLDHAAESSLHGRALAPSFDDFIARWSAVGCAGPESWELKPFLGADGIDPTGESAQIWVDWRNSTLSGPA
jgi:hypothetical protein